MSRAFDDAVAEVRRRRAALLATLAELRGRATPPQLADDVLRRLDPEFTLLRRLRKRVARNKLVALALVAGAGWLAGASRPHGGKPPATRKGARAKPKEKNNDSGHQQRQQQRAPGPGWRPQVPRPQGSAQAQWVFA